MDKKNLKVVYKLAWSFHKTSRVDFDDLFQEAAIACMEGEKTYKPEKGKEITHIYQVITNHLINFVKREFKYHMTFLLVNEYLDSPVQKGLFFDFYHSLSAEGREVADVVLNNKSEILVNQQRAKSIVRQKLREKGYSYKKAGQKMKKLSRDLQNV